MTSTNGSSASIPNSFRISGDSLYLHNSLTELVSLNNDTLTISSKVVSSDFFFHCVKVGSLQSRRTQRAMESIIGSWEWLNSDDGNIYTFQFKKDFTRLTYGNGILLDSSYYIVTENKIASDRLFSDFSISSDTFQIGNSENGTELFKRVDFTPHPPESAEYLLYYHSLTIENLKQIKELYEEFQNDGIEINNFEEFQRVLSFRFSEQIKSNKHFNYSIDKDGFHATLKEGIQLYQIPQGHKITLLKNGNWFNYETGTEVKPYDPNEIIE